MMAVAESCTCVVYNRRRSPRGQSKHDYYTSNFYAQRTFADKVNSVKQNQLIDVEIDNEQRALYSCHPCVKSYYRLRQPVGPEKVALA